MSNGETKSLSFLIDDPLEPGTDSDPHVKKSAETLFKTLSHIPSDANQNKSDETSRRLRRSIQNLIENNEIKFEDHHKNAINRKGVTCAVFGAWGSGKTTFLKEMQEQYRQTGSRTIWFDPWRYESEEHLLIPLLVEISSCITKDIKTVNLKQAALETGKALLGGTLKAVWKTGSEAIERRTGMDVASIPETAMKHFDETSTDWSETLSETTKFRQSLHDMVYLAAAGSREKENTKSKEESIKDGASKYQYPVAVFIDDLDRCDAGQVRRLIESIKIFLDTPGCVFFLALDEEQVQFALSEPYRDVFAQSDGLNIRALTYGHRYLDKFLQHSLYLNESHQPYRDSMEELRDEVWLELEREINNDSELSPHIETIFYMVKLNPRAIKKCARWLYTMKELLGRNELVKRFAEMVFFVNYETIWIGELQGKSQDSRKRFFSMVVEVFGGKELLRTIKRSPIGSTIFDKKMKRHIERFISYLSGDGGIVNNNKEHSGADENLIASAKFLSDNYPEFLVLIKNVYAHNETSELYNILLLSNFYTNGIKSEF